MLQYRAGAARHQPLRFPGQEYDAADGEREYNIFRWYKPQFGRFDSVDPAGAAIADPQSWNRYGYVMGNPIAMIDPTGRCTFIPCLNYGSAEATVEASDAAGDAPAEGAWESTVLDMAIGSSEFNAQAAKEWGKYQSGYYDAIAPDNNELLVAMPLAATAVAPEAAVADVAFSQTTASPWFHAEGDFAGQTISDVASQLRTGVLSPADVPVQSVTLDGVTLIVNTRSSLALMQAGISPSNWWWIDMTANPSVMAEIEGCLAYNGLTTAGSSVIRITGAGSAASTYAGAGTVPMP